MGKTATTSLINTIPKYGIEMHSTHMMSEKNEKLVLKSYSKQPITILDDLLSKAEDCRKNAKDAKFISLVREPVAHAICVMFQNVKLLFSKHNIKNAPDFNRFFCKTCEEAMAGEFQPQHYMVQLAMNFMDWDVNPYLGIDVYETPFTEDYQIYENRWLLVRFENLKCISKAIKDFLNIDDFILQHVNSTKNKKIGKLYETVKETLSLPKHISEWFTSSRYYQHFYKNFKPFWMN